MHKGKHNTNSNSQYGSIQLADKRSGSATSYSKLRTDDQVQTKSQSKHKLGKLWNIGGGIALGTLIATVVILLIKSGEESSQLSSPCADKAEGVYTSGLMEMLNIVVGQTVDFAARGTVLLCDAGHKQFSKISRACLNAISTTDALSFPGTEHLQICRNTIEEFIPALHSAKTIATAIGQGEIGWDIKIFDTAGGMLMTNGTIAFSVTEAHLRHALTASAESATATSSTWGSMLVQAGANLYQTASTALTSTAGDAYHWATRAFGF